MARLGNNKGPLHYSIIAAQGPEFYGITPDALANEIEELVSEESKEGDNTVRSVRVDRSGRLYIIVNGPHGTQPLYLRTSDFTGRILVIFDGQGVEQEIDVADLPKSREVATAAQ